MTVATSTTITTASICLQGGWAFASDDGRHNTTNDKMLMDTGYQDDDDATSMPTTAASIYLQGGWVAAIDNRRLDR